MGIKINNYKFFGFYAKDGVLQDSERAESHTLPQNEYLTG